MLAFLKAAHIVQWGIKPPLKNTTSLFLPKPKLSKPPHPPPPKKVTPSFLPTLL